MQLHRPNVLYLEDVMTQVVSHTHSLLMFHASNDRDSLNRLVSWYHVKV